MKKGFFAVGCVALSGCLLISFAGCSTVSKAKNMRGEEVTAEQWDSAMAASAFRTSGGASAPVQTVADETAEAPNYRVEYEMTYKVNVSTEGVSVGDTQLTEAANLNIDMTSSATLTVADNALHVSFKYDFKFDGSENLLAALGMSEELAGSGESEAYVSFADGATFIVKDSNGNWIRSSTDGEEIGAAGQFVMMMSAGLMDQSALVGAFSQYTYSADDKGYVAADSSVSGELGDVLFSGAGKLVYKIRDGHLAAVYAEGSASSGIVGISSEGSSEIGLVYTYGGQSVTLPAVS